MTNDNPIKLKSKAFAIRIIKLYQHLCRTKHVYVLSKQLLRSGTSIGANVSEALCSISKKDFLAKMYIAFKECVETQYWLEIMADTGILTKNEFNSISQDCEEIRKLLSSITKSTSESLNS